MCVQVSEELHNQEKASDEQRKKMEAAINRVRLKKANELLHKLTHADKLIDEMVSHTIKVSARHDKIRTLRCFSTRYHHTHHLFVGIPTVLLHVFNSVIGRLLRWHLTRRILKRAYTASKSGTSQRLFALALPVAALWHLCISAA